MEFFENIFNSIADVSSSLPSIPIGTFFFIVLAVIIGVGLVLGLTYFASSAYKMKSASKKIIKYLSGVEEINDDNAASFTNACFSNSAPRHLREGWIKYLGVEFGYPSEVVSEKYAFDGDVKKQSNARANIFIAIALILVGVLAFWAFGLDNSASVAVIVCAGLILSGIIYLVLVVIGKKLFQQARTTFYDMQDELDAKVNFHIEKDYSTDTSPLVEMTSIIDEIIARNIAKEIEVPFVEEKLEDEEPEPQVEMVDYEPAANGETPIEELIDNTPDNVQEEQEDIESVESESVEETQASDEVTDENPAEIEENAQAEENQIENVVEEPVEEQVAPVEEQADEEKINEISDILNSSMVAATMEKQKPVNVMKEEGVGDWLAGQNEFGMASPVEAFEEVNVKDDEIMFGKKKKEAKLAAERAAAEQAAKEQEEKDFVEAELDDEPDELEEVAPEAPAAAPAPAVAPAQQDELPPEFKRTLIEAAPVAEIQPEIIEQFEDLDEGDDEIKAPRLAKLPHLVDYIVADPKTTKATKVKMAQLMLQAYTVFKKSPENKVIILQCLKKVMDSLKPEN